MEEKHELFFIAIIPPPEICEQVIRFKEDFAQRFSSKRALRLIPHITLLSPFRMPENSHDQVLNWFRELPISVHSFMIELINFGKFPKKKNPVVFIKCKLNSNLGALQQEIAKNFNKHFAESKMDDTDLAYKPHITVAYRDLGAEAFRIAWSEYKLKEYKATFQVKEVHLLKHDNQQWYVVESFKLLG